MRHAGYDTPIRAIYRVRGSLREAEKIARAIAWEQTVELPEGQVTDTAILERVVGRVEAVEAAEPEANASGHCRITLAYNPKLAVGGLGGLLNLVYGNVSMYDGLRLVDLELPDEWLVQLRGPRYGIAGLRKLIGVQGRPLLATALKPRGSSNEALAAMAEAFALGGGDIVKDDQNLVDSDFDGFRRRVDACATAVEHANAKTGRRCLYLPHLAGHDGMLNRAAEFVRLRELAGVLVCPMSVGLDRARRLCEQYDLAFMAHPALTGAYTQGREHGIDHHVLLGTFFRLAGADISVFPASGGRFNVDAEQCEATAKALRRPLGSLRAVLPAPAGGMRLESVSELARDYGADALWLVGGALHSHPGGLAGGTRAFLDALRERFEEQIERPARGYRSVCDYRKSPAADTQALRGLIPALDDFRWEGREDQQYKTTDEIDFRGVRRVELIGKQGEQAKFELRYFELEPGGYTSLEKHVHTHVLIGARGTGILFVGEERRQLKPDDVAYVAPLEVHQLRNDGDSAFGFYCIVDKDRDRPLPP